MSNEEFPKFNIGELGGIEIEYQVHWLSSDCAMLTVGGEEIIQFASAHTGGFVNAEDVLAQAGDVILQLEDGDWD